MVSFCYQMGVGMVVSGLLLGSEGMNGSDITPRGWTRTTPPQSIPVHPSVLKVKVDSYYCVTGGSGWYHPSLFRMIMCSKFILGLIKFYYGFYRSKVTF